MLIGYARVSTNEQNLDLQRDALEKEGCEKIYVEEASGSKSSRPELERTIEMLREGDTLVVWRLDRLGRSLKHLIELVTELEGKGIGFKSITESMDTSTNNGKLIFHIFGALAEFERNLIRERTQAGLASARARGRMGGRPHALDDKEKATAVNMYNSKKHSVVEICKLMGISRPTLLGYVREANSS